MSEDRPLESRVTCRRRRRKRPLQTSGGSEGSRHVLAASVGEGGNKRRSERGITNSGEHDVKTDEKRKDQSIPEMLYMRATGRMRLRDFPSCLALATRNASKLGKRSIRFSQLQSSNSEAVLALDHSGSYFVSLAGNTAAFTLALLLYAVPSPSWIENARLERDQSIVSPLVTTIPLEMPSADDTGNR